MSDELTRYATIAITVPSLEWLTDDGECTEGEGWETIQSHVETYLRRFWARYQKGTAASIEWEDWDAREETV